MSKITKLNRISLTALGFQYDESEKIWISDADFLLLEEDYIFEEDIFVRGHLIITGSVIAKNIFCKTLICLGKLKGISVICPKAAIVYDNLFLDFLETDKLQALRGINIEKCNVKDMISCNGPCLIKSLDINHNVFERISKHGLNLKTPNSIRKPE